MTTTRRMAHGLLTSPGKDLAMFSDMAKQGMRLTGVASPFRWTFEEAEPEDVVFAIDWADRAALDRGKPREDYLETFRVAGWEHVFGVDTMQIFKAPPGTRPIHTDPASARDTHRGLVRRYLAWSALAVLVFAAAMILNAAVKETWAVIILAVAAFPVAFTVLPLVSLLWGRRNPKRARAMWTMDGNA